MREIKFRYVIKDEEGVELYIRDPYDVYLTLEGELYTVDNDKLDAKIIQYTDLKDKNGEMVFEGDIVKVSEEYGGHAYSPLVVDFKDCCFVLRRTNYMADYNPMFKYDFTHVYEVIGNIYENPELLSDEKSILKEEELK